MQHFLLYEQTYYFKSTSLAWSVTVGFWNNGEHFGTLLEDY